MTLAAMRARIHPHAGVALLFMAAFLLAGYLGSRSVRVWYDRQLVTCLPYRLYVGVVELPATLDRGSIYYFRAQGLAPHFADGTLLAKKVAALPGDQVRVDREGVFVNGVRWGSIDPPLLRALGLTANAVERTYQVRPGEVLMLGTHPQSYDGRYYGAIRSTQILGRVHPLW